MVPSNCFICCTVVTVALAVISCNGGLLGGASPVSVHDDDVKEAAAFAEVELNKMSNNMYYMITSEIIKAEKQIVKGTNYFLTLEMTSTDCRKNNKFPSDSEIDECKVSDKEDATRIEECDVQVYVDLPDENQKQQRKIANFECKPVDKNQAMKQDKLTIH